MTKEKVNLMRCPEDSNCLDCGEEIEFGVYCYYNEETGEAVCIECGVKRGWEDKQRVQKLIKRLELDMDIKALQKVKKAELKKLSQIKLKVKFYTLAERHHELEQKVLACTETANSYLKQCGTAKEKEVFGKLIEVINETQRTQQKVQMEVEDQLYMIDSSEYKELKKLKRKKRKVEQ